MLTAPAPRVAGNPSVKGARSAGRHCTSSDTLGNPALLMRAGGAKATTGGSYLAIRNYADRYKSTGH